MVTGNAPIKTPDGRAELATRARQLSQRHRTVLLLVNGRRSEEQVKRLAEQAGVPPSCYDDLLHMGLIMVPQPTMSIEAAPYPALPAAQVDLALPDLDAAPLPPSGPLAPASTLNGDLGGYDPWAMVQTDYSDLGDLDGALEQARDLLIRAVRADAPVAGSLTLMRLRRARDREDLLSLLDEVEQRLWRPQRELETARLMRRVRRLIGAAADSTLSDF
ncbi:hypothetical protein FSC37_17365 [Piscinibacter aquaticus]|uniref:Uncharacterized protein n=1 Tax=Piscinibacter aquaticus TaxID=392597 RepID=A0A5C6U4E3_9BURK|nr:hypothetical protein FSC37_17365 [Piscinibacter aquaticus]